MTDEMCTFCGHGRKEHREFNYFTKRPDRKCVASGLTLNGYAHTSCSCEAFTEVKVSVEVVV